MKNNILQAALEYQQRGWSLIPLVMAQKRPAVNWKRYQTQRANDSTLRKWFRNDEIGIGVVFGSVSGGLLSRDFDTIESYKQWARNHSDLAQILPTAATNRGRHVYASVSQKHVADIRLILGKPDGVGAIAVADGELRCGVGCYSVLPPSVHLSGVVYRWEVPLPDGPLPDIDIFASDFYQTSYSSSSPSSSSTKLTRELRGFGSCNGEYRDHGGIQRLQKNTEAIFGDCKKRKKTSSDPGDWSDSVQWAIVDSVPEGPGQRHRQVFELARGLKAVPELADAKAANLKPHVRQWHKLSLVNITTKAFEETWIDFLKAWPRVKYPKGEDPMKTIFQNAAQQPLPNPAHKYEQDGLRLLVSLCRELQRSAGEGPFYLSCRTAGRLLDVHHTTANRWLYLLVNDELLVVVEKGDRAKHRASRYRYLGEL